MVHLEDIYSLTEFQRHTKEHIARLKQTGRPEVLTVNGRAELVVQDAVSYQKLLELLDYAEAVEGIKQGLESMRQGKGRPAAEVLQHLRDKHQMPYDQQFSFWLRRVSGLPIAYDLAKVITPLHPGGSDDQPLILR